MYFVGIMTVFLTVMIWHECGHLLAAKWTGIPVRRISLGFGPILWRRHLNAETEFALRALPLGMAIGVPGRRDGTGRLRRPVASDMWVAVGGPLASFLLTALLLVMVLTIPLPPTVFDWVVGAGLLSVLLAVLNLIPAPGLDGGHLLVLIAAWFGWELAPQQEARLHRMGMQAMVLLCIPAIGIQVWSWLGV
jgi:membrane-associated protease RseP (regulator of RpoE activity)